MKRFKYPRTPHLPWSPGRGNDDKVLSSTDHFNGQDIVVTEKMDGECTTIYADGYLHARSLDYTRHESRSGVKALAAVVGPLCAPLNIHRICGENLTAVHSIRYTDLPALYLVYSIWSNENRVYDWESTRTLAYYLGLTTVPVLFTGKWEEFIKYGVDGLAGTEGYVVRTARDFAYEDFNKHVAKFVFADHVQTDEHWLSKQIEYNTTVRPHSR